jgi:alpha-galactosidase/6-phospho-beta-glucosidase family protein
MARQSNKLGLKISLPQNIQPEQTTQAPKKETVFETDKFGTLTVKNILPADGSRATVETDKGTFYFYTTDYINKGKESEGKQFYSKAFIHPELRQQVDENSVAVNIQDAPNSIFTNKERTTLSNETGILIPKDVATDTIQRYTGIHDIDKNGRITGISNGRYLLDNSGSKKTTYICTLKQ